MARYWSRSDLPPGFSARAKLVFHGLTGPLNSMHGFESYLVDVFGDWHLETTFISA